MRYMKKRHYQWSSAIAYSVGLIASDGCLQKDGRHIDLTSKDTDQLENFMKSIGRSLRVSTKKSGAGNIAYRLQFSDVAYYDFLLLCGLTSNKSTTISSLLIPDAYYPDFLRGLFDGDGSAYAYIDQRWRSSFMFYVTFTSASLEFLNFIQKTNTRLITTTSGSIRKSGRAYTLSYAKSDTRILFSSMYYSESVTALNRKYQKLKHFTTLGIDDTII